MPKTKKPKSRQPKLQTANLPPEQQQRLHADFLANEQTYLHIRDSLLLRYRGQWVAVHDGRVIAAGEDLLTVTEAAAVSGGHPYIARVGEEDAVVFRVRRAVFAYDRTYQPFALPRVTVAFWNHAETQSQTYSDVVPDTGADLSVLPDSDCAAFDLFSSPYFTGVSSGVVGGSVTTLIYRGKAEINGNRVPAFIQPITGGQERIVGRDVLNQHCVVFDGPAGEVIFEP
jgi:predicted aspartyl protease